MSADFAGGCTLTHTAVSFRDSFSSSVVIIVIITAIVVVY